MRRNSRLPKISRSLPIEYFLLTNYRSEGATIVLLDEEPIAETVVDPNGSRYRFVGIAPRLSDGRFDVTSLRAGEWIVGPRLIYLMEKMTKAA